MCSVSTSLATTLWLLCVCMMWDSYNSSNLQWLQFTTVAIYNSCNLQQLQFTTVAIYSCSGGCRDHKCGDCDGAQAFKVRCWCLHPSCTPLAPLLHPSCTPPAPPPAPLLHPSCHPPFGASCCLHFICQTAATETLVSFAAMTSRD